MATLSGQRTVTTAGTEVQLSATSIVVNGPVMIKALTTNTGLVYVGNVDGTVSSATGMPLTSGQVLILDHVVNLNQIWVDSAVNGEGVAWISLSL